MDHKCDKEDVIDIIRDDLKEIKTDIKELLKFKAMVIGISSLVSLVVGIAVNIASNMIR